MEPMYRIVFIDFSMSENRVGFLEKGKTSFYRGNSEVFL